MLRRTDGRECVPMSTMERRIPGPLPDDATGRAAWANLSENAFSDGISSWVGLMMLCKVGGFMPCVKTASAGLS